MVFLTPMVRGAAGGKRGLRVPERVDNGQGVTFHVRQKVKAGHEPLDVCGV